MRLRHWRGVLLLIICSAGAPAQDAKRMDISMPTTLKANPDPAGHYHIGDGVSAPELISSVSPDFTAKHVGRHFTGSCSVALTVDATGQPQNVHLVQSIGDGKLKIPNADAVELDRNALDAVRQYRFAPALFQGKAVPVEIKVEVDVDVI